MSDQVNPRNVPPSDELSARKPPTDMQLGWLVTLLHHARADERACTLLFGEEYTKLANLSQHAVEWGIGQVLTYLQEINYNGEDDDDFMPRVFN